MIKTKNLPLIAYSVLTIIWLYTFYVSVLAPPFFGYFTVDENYVADSGVFLWYGNTPRCLDWPATPSVLIFFLMFGVSMLFNFFTSVNTFQSILDVFESIDRTAFHYLTSRESLILSGRTIQLVIVGVVLYLLLRYLYRTTGPLLNDLSRNVLVFIIITSYLVWFNAPVLRPEALAGSLFIYLFARLLFSDSLSVRECNLFALLFGVILAERLLFVFVAPILVGGIYFKSTQRRFQRTIYFILLTISVFMVLCPFLITDPLVVLKSFFGGILAKMQDKPMATFLNYEFIGEYFKNPVSYLIVLFALLGGGVLIRQRKIFNYILIGNWIFFLFLVLRSAKIYDTHVLPAGIFTLFALALGISFIAEKAGRRQYILAVVLSIPVVAMNLLDYIKFQQRSHVISPTAMAYNWIHTLPSETTLLVHPELEFYLPKSKQTLNRYLEMNRDSMKMVRKLNFLMGNQGPTAASTEDLPYVARSFAFEDERLYEIQFQLLRKYADKDPAKKYTYQVYLDNTILASASVQTATGIENFIKGKYEYMVTDMPLVGLEPLKFFANEIYPTVFVYKSPAYL